MKLTAAQLAARMCVSPRTVMRWVSRDGLPIAGYRHFDGKPRRPAVIIDMGAFHAWLLRHPLATENKNVSDATRMAVAYERATARRLARLAYIESHVSGDMARTFLESFDRSVA